MRNKGLIWVIVILVIVVGLLVGKLVFYNGQNTTNATSTTSTATTSNPATSTQTPVTPAPKLTPTTTPDGTADAWNTEVNTNDGFKISYPPDFSLKDDSIFLVDQNTTGTEIDFPATYTTGTNLHQAYVGITRRMVESQFNCFVAFNGSQIALPTSTIKINGVEYYKLDETDAGAGNLYEDVRYATYKGNYCYNVALFLHSVQRLNYPPETRPAEFDRATVTSFFDQIMKTFNIL